MKLMSASHRRQRGAALVVGMILLMVLTVLAISGMSTATTELIMAGNEQYQENAFQSAEYGIEQALNTGAFSTSVASEAVGNTAVPGSTREFYNTNITPQPAPNTELPLMWGGNNASKFTSYHFQIQSQGTSSRNATTTHTQGLFIIALKNGESPPPLPGAPTALTP
jgi:Tfp pilus assembly protein PilX